MTSSRAALVALAWLAAASVPLACTLATSGTAGSPKSGAGGGATTATASGTSADTGAGGSSTSAETGAGGASPTTAETSTTGAGGSGGAPAVCGDGTVTAPEECDDGNTLAADGCSPACAIEHPDACPGTAITLGYGSTSVSGDTTGAGDDASASCGGVGAGDFVYAVTAVGDGTLDVVVDGAHATIVHVRAACDDGATELACNDDAPSEAKLVVTKGTTYYVYVDGAGDGDEGTFELTLTLSPCGNGKLDPGEECDDANVTDGDGCNACLVVCAGDHPFEDPATKHCYDFVKSSKHWQSAEDACVARGGHLAAISSQGEFDLVDQQDLSDDVWLGGTDAANEGTWLWTNGEPWGFTHWDGGEPSNTGGNGGEDCLIERPDTTWNDDPCSFSKDYLCEFPPPVKSP
jgi:cysteine-rich repeat protein